MHYFASRDASEDENVLTWPQGNGWIVERLEEVLKQRITTSSLVYRIEQDGSRATVDVYNTHEQRSTRVIADRVIFACPSFLARHVVSGLSDRLEALDQFEYAPWLVANLTLGELPAVRSGVPLAWDNVIYDNPSLGYVVATHQALSTHPRETVLTYYRALAGASPAEDRKRLLEMSWQDCVEMILADLAKPHPEMRDIVRNIDVMKWGHAMIRPRPGFLWGSARQQMSKPLGRIHFANSDLSGFSIFEEAQYRGVTAADAALAKL
jgi:monoamine oxidase